MLPHQPTITGPKAAVRQPRLERYLPPLRGEVDDIQILSNDHPAIESLCAFGPNGFGLDYGNKVGEH
jgi:hypothetical protein